jgi:Kef-type K+ transport system membrane component KefB
VSEAVGENGLTLITIGALLLIGLTTNAIGRRTRLPRVTLLLVFGLAIGPTGLDLLPDPGRAWFPLVASMALAMVGFLLGEHLTLGVLRAHGRVVLSVSLAEVLLTALLVGAGLALLGVPIEVALLLAGIATATAPAATQEVAHEVGARGPFTDTLLGIVAIDDAWGLILFSLALVGVGALTGAASPQALLLSGLWEIGGAIALGVAIGLPMAWIVGRLPPGELTLTGALGMVFLCAGIAEQIGVSFLLACVVLGAWVANEAKHPLEPFHELERIEWPFMIVFFVLAGATMRPETFLGLGGAGVAYVLLRAAGRVGGAALAPGAGPIARRWLGLALMPQAGVAIGMALITAQRFPELGHTVLPVVIGATVFFELIGPLLTRLALARAGEIPESSGQ